ncbi:helix-turn-helix domain-containing protein [Terriglobus roseus]|uniref:Helix-turn-helix domain-containing protein n=1 Tax=Terriglobus roseus TaxID=392734 RepID=A0A1H4JVL0_9BACT|nr:Helix-turn-helix domain-containing protein [Terriglobus roseus]
MKDPCSKSQLEPNKCGVSTSFGRVAFPTVPVESPRLRAKRAFSREVGMPPAEYIQQERIAVTKKWLLETPLSIREMATRMAFSSKYHFMRSFKQSTGKTPGRWRSTAIPPIV